MGTATAGIAHAAIAAHLLGLPMGYVRSGSKDHGRRNQIEGKLEPRPEGGGRRGPDLHRRQRAWTVVDALRDAGARGAGRRQHLHLRHAQGPGSGWPRPVSRTSASPIFDAVAQVARPARAISQQEDVARLLAFRDDPSDESWIRKGE